MKTEHIGNLTIHHLDDFEEAAQGAYRYAMNSMADVLPVVIFKQGQRYHLSGALHYSLVTKLLYAQPAKKKEPVESVASTTNRPFDKAHADEITNYLQNNRQGRYVLGGLTLNIREPLTLFTARGIMPPAQLGYLLLPRTASISITDGQHRQAAIRRVLDSLSAEDAQEMALDAIAVDITNETDVVQIHQDFADASKTKPLPPGLLAIYDMRNPANRVVVELERTCPLLKGRVDATSRTLSKNSAMLFTANQVRQFVKVLLTGSWQMGTAQFDKAAFELLGKDEEDFRSELGKAAEYLNALTDAIPVWAEVASIGRGIAATKVRDIRSSGYVCLSAPGLVILARLGHEFFKKDISDWKDYVAKLGKIDWSKDGPLWEGNVVSSDKKIVVHQKLVRAATEKVRDAIGWAGVDVNEELAFEESEQKSVETTAA